MATPEYRQVTLTLQDDGSYIAKWPTLRYRFLLSDGRTVDIATSRDDSDLRAAVLTTTGAERIEGVVRLQEAPPTPEKKVPTKRRRVHPE